MLSRRPPCKLFWMIKAAATSFAGLSDTPVALGTAGQVPAVNAAGDALEFTDVEGVTGSSEEFLFDNHPDLVQIGTLNTVINLTTTSVVLAETPDPVPTADGFLLIDSEVMDITAVNGSTLTVTRAARGTTATAHVAGVGSFLLDRREWRDRENIPNSYLGAWKHSRKPC